MQTGERGSPFSTGNVTRTERRTCGGAGLYSWRGGGGGAVKCSSGPRPPWRVGGGVREGVVHFGVIVEIPVSI